MLDWLESQWETVKDGASDLIGFEVSNEVERAVNSNRVESSGVLQQSGPSVSPVQKPDKSVSDKSLNLQRIGVFCGVAGVVFAAAAYFRGGR